MGNSFIENAKKISSKVPIQNDGIAYRNSKVVNDATSATCPLLAAEMIPRYIPIM